LVLKAYRVGVAIRVDENCFLMYMAVGKNDSLSLCSAVGLYVSLAVASCRRVLQMKKW